MIEPSGGASGQASDIALHAKEILRIRAVLTDIYAEHCQMPDETRDAARERFGEFDLAALLMSRKGVGEGLLYDFGRGVGVWHHRQDCGEEG